VQVLSWRFLLRHATNDGRLRRSLERMIDNLGTRLLLSPLLWMIDNGMKKGPLLTVVARPEQA
jgi:hypothetical protein